MSVLMVAKMTDGGHTAGYHMDATLRRYRNSKFYTYLASCTLLDGQIWVHTHCPALVVLDMHAPGLFQVCDAWIPDREGLDSF